MKYEEITTPEALLEWMQDITYGYQGKTKFYRYGDNNFNEDWFKEYILEEPTELIKTKIGNCWDQTELERYWFENHNYKVKTVYEMVNLPYKNPYPTHSFLIYQDKNNNWNWFENSDFNNRGIHTKKTEKELIDYQMSKYKKFLKTFNITEEELEKVVIKEFTKPKSNCSAEEYINHVLTSKDYKGE